MEFGRHSDHAASIVAGCRWSETLNEANLDDIRPARRRTSYTAINNTDRAVHTARTDRTARHAPRSLRADTKLPLIGAASLPLPWRCHGAPANGR